MRDDLFELGSDPTPNPELLCDLIERLAGLTSSSVLIELTRDDDPAVRKGLIKAILYSREATAEEKLDSSKVAKYVQENGTINPFWAELSASDYKPVMEAFVPVMMETIEAGDNLPAIIDLLVLRDEANGFFRGEEVYDPIIGVYKASTASQESAK